jgi:hypothetical protein
MKKLILGGVAVLVVIGGVVGFEVSSRDDTKSTTQASHSSQVRQSKQTEITYQGAAGKSALDLLKQSYQAETKDYSGLGEMVTSINGKAADSKHFWAFYINGQQSQQGASSYITKANDKITWKLEEIK